MGYSVKYITAGQFSSAGLKPTNDDACNFSIPDGAPLFSKGAVAVIADGVSSSAGAADASRACVQGFVSDYYSTPDSWTVTTAASKIYSALNHWLLGHGQQFFSGHDELVTTLSALIIKSSTASLFHVGDSRIYHWREKRLEQITRDHRVSGQGGKTYLGRAMGINTHVEVDAHRLSLRDGDGFLLCTDGVHEFISDGEISRIINQELDHPQSIAEKICQQALENGSDDNLSCQFLLINQLPEEDDQSHYQRLQSLPFPPELSPGMEIDGYKILRELHSSPRTQVFLALDLRADKETEAEGAVVIKTPSVNYEDDSTYLETFQHEEWVGLRLHSNHVLQIHDVRERRRFLYTVTEHINGITLRQWMNDNPNPSLVEVRQIAEQIIRGIRTFHRMEMVHRDLKPENIMIDPHGTIKIIDFGSTRISGIEEIRSPIDQTRFHSTRNYTAPEMLQGAPGSPLSDQFSLGVILYEMLCGKLPYGDLGDHPSIKKVIQKIQRHHYTSPHHYREDLPHWVSRTLQKVTSPVATERYTALTELYRDLTRPNPSFQIESFQPLIERDPLVFWRTLSLVLVLANILLLILLGT